MPKIRQFRQSDQLLDGPRDEAVHEAELARFLERRPEPLVAKALADSLHAEVGTMKGFARFIGPAGIALELPEREFGLPILDGVSDLCCQRQRGAQMLFGAVPIPLCALELAGQAPALDQVLA